MGHPRIRREHCTREVSEVFEMENGVPKRVGVHALHLVWYGRQHMLIGNVAETVQTCWAATVGRTGA
jgi:hypothetical protein